MPTSSHATAPEQLWQRRLLALIATLLLLWTVWATLVLPRLGPVEGARYILRGIVVRVLLWVVPSAVYLWRQHEHDRFGRLGLGLPPSARNAWLSLFTIAAAGFAVSLDVARKLSATPLHVWRLLFESISLEPPFAEFFEELVFRGVIFAELLALLQVSSRLHSGVSGRARFWLANLAASLVFVGLHWPWWIYTEGFGIPFLTKTGGVLLISLVLGMVFVLGRSLWPCVALHWLNNALSALAASK